MKKLLLILALGAVSLTACNNETALTQSQYLPEGNLTLTVLNVADNTLVTGVKATLYGVNNDEVRTSETGTFKWENLRAGNYELLLEKEGYASMTLDVDHELVAVEERPVVAQTTVNALMHKLTGKYEGRAFYEETTAKTGVRRNVEGAEITFDMSPLSANAEFVNHIFMTTTDASGNFVFENLPEFDANNTPQPDYSTILVNGITFYGSLASVVTEKNNYMNVEVEYSNSMGPQFQVISGVARVAANEAIVLTLNHSVELDMIDDSSIVVQENYVDVAFNAAWSNGNKTLTLTPISGTWSADGEVLVTVNLYRKGDLAVYSNSFTVGVTGMAVTNIANLAATVDPSANAFVELTFTASSNADDYEVYRKCSDEPNFTLVNSNLSQSEAEVNGVVTVTITDGDPQFVDDENESNTYMIVPMKYASGRLPYSSALTVVATATF